MKSVEHYGFFKDGRWHMDSFVRALRSLQGRPVVLTVDESRERRSTQANRYYWGVCVKLISEALKDSGWEPRECTAEAVHTMLKFRFLREDRPVGKDGEFVTIIRSTADLEGDEFGAYIEHVVQFAAEYLSTVIPPPLSQAEMDYEDAA